MRIKYFVTSAIIFLSLTCSSQNQNNVWYFGDHAGLSFNTVPPATLNDGVFTHAEGVASICDINGNLLFFTNGLDVWNANRVRMPNGFGLLGNSSSTQVLIMPKPGNCNIYYIFTVPAQSFTGPFCYTVVDMSLNSGLGDVSSKNNVLRTGVTERVTGTLKSNGVDYWVVTQELGSNAFLAYSLTSTGINPIPVVSNAGIANLTASDVLGYMKISSNGAKLATACLYGHGRSQLFDFANSTGIVSNGIILNSDQVGYGVEFSPDNSKLYFATANAPFIITQYNLLAGSAVAISNSGVEIVNQYIVNGVPQYGGALQLGPDNKIYVCRLTKAFLDVIDQPNLLGAACNYTFNGIDLNGHKCQVGLPNGIKNYGTISCPTLTATVTHTTCGNSNGTITASYNYGLPPYQYSLDGVNFQSSNVFTGLGSGNYIVSAKDANQVLLTVNKTINPSLQVQCSISSVANATCGFVNGSITASPVGGTAPFQYSIDGGTTYQSTNIFTGLTGGSYTVTIKDASNCLNNSPTVIVVSIAGVTVTGLAGNPTCGLANGTITASAVGGTAPFQYSINGGTTYQTSNIFTGLIAGSYAVTIKDGNNCLNNSPTIIVTSIAGATVTGLAGNSTCGLANGTITASPVGGTAPFQYSINGGTTYQSSNIFTGLIAGSYTVTIKDGSNCLNNSPVVTISNIAGATITGLAGNSTCGLANGTITASAVGGTAPFQYSINGGTTYQFSNIFTGLLAGSYTVTIKDGNNCLNNSPTVIVANVAGATITGLAGNATCGLANGTITASAVGGTAPFQYSIDGGTTYQSSNNFTGLIAANYTITIKDVNGCLNNTAVITVKNTAGATIAATSTNAVCGFNNGKIIANAFGGTSPYQYSIDGGMTYQNSNIFTHLAPANYIVYIKDANSCINTTFIVVGNTAMPMLQVFAGKDTGVLKMQPLQLNALDVNNTGFVSYTWSPAYGLSRSDIKDPISILDRDFAYEVTAATADGCVTKDSIKIKIFHHSEIYVPTAFTPNGDGKNDVLRPKLIGVKELKYFIVFDRYGEIIYRTSSENQGWNGVIKGASQNTGTYIWIAEAIDYLGKTIFRKGATVLIR